MSKDDEEKTAFCTDHGVFCYTKMSFGLKAYVEAMVIKCLDERRLLHDVGETLQTLEKAKMKLNPAKCTFRVEEGQFLGYYVTNGGIQPSPVKIDELKDAPSPGTLRDAQGQNSKLMSLNRFISKSANKATYFTH